MAHGDERRASIPAIAVGPHFAHFATRSVELLNERDLPRLFLLRQTNGRAQPADTGPNDN